MFSTMPSTTSVSPIFCSTPTIWPVAASPNWKRSAAPCNALRKAAKPIIAIGDNFSQQQYFLAAHADEIIINPMGRIMLTGFGSYTSYYKEALDKLKVNMHIFRVGKYKSAVEPYMPIVCPTKRGPIAAN